jgi:hypothetical protein
MPSRWQTQADPYPFPCRDPRVLTFPGFATLGLVRLLPLQPGLYESHSADVRAYRALRPCSKISDLFRTQVL